MKDSLRLLYLEDDELEKKAFARFVDEKHLAYETRYASKLSEAEDILSKEKFDVILADYKLPDGTGLDLINTVSGSPIIVVTSYGEQMVSLRATTLGVSDYIIKEPDGKHFEKLAQSIEWVTAVRSNPILVKKEISILLIEDNKLDQRSFERALSKNPSYHYHFVSTIKEAIYILNSEIFDIVIVDASLPDGTTAEIFPFLKEIPFIVVAGQGSEEYVSLAYQHGASDYLIKDVDRFYLKLLPTTIEKTLQIHKMREIKNHFVSFLAHEIRTPLTIIDAAVTNIIDGTYGSLSGDLSKILHTLQDHTKRLGHVVNDILNLSRLESGKARIVLSSISLKGLTQKVLEECEKIKGRELVLKNEVPEDFPKIWADETMIYSLLINLLSNALRFAKKEVIVKAKVVDEHFLEMSIIDDGIGISEQEQTKLFNKFEQVKRMENIPGYRGTGLGLVICKQIVQHHQGNIWVESSKGKGAQFHFVLSLDLKK